MFSRKSAPVSASPEDMIATLGMATAAWEAGSIDKLMEFWTDDCVIIHNAAHPDVPFYGTFRGKKEFARWCEEFGPKNIAMQEICFAEHAVSSPNSVFRSGFCKYSVNKTKIAVESVMRHTFVFDAAGKIKSATFCDDSNAIVQAFRGKTMTARISKDLLWPTSMAFAGDYVAQLGKISQAWKTGDMKMMEANCCEDYQGLIGTVDSDCGVPFMGTFKGMDGFREFIKGFASITVDSVAFHSHAVAHMPNMGIVTRLAEFSFTVKDTGKKVDVQFHERFCMDITGKLKWMEIVTDAEKIMSAFRKTN